MSSIQHKYANSKQNIQIFSWHLPEQGSTSAMSNQYGRAHTHLRREQGSMHGCKCDLGFYQSLLSANFGKD